MARRSNLMQTNTEDACHTCFYSHSLWLVDDIVKPRNGFPRWIVPASTQTPILNSVARPGLPGREGQKHLSCGLVPWPLDTSCSRGARLIVVPGEVCVIAKLPGKD